MIVTDLRPGMVFTFHNAWTLYVDVIVSVVPMDNMRMTICTLSARQDREANELIPYTFDSFRINVDDSIYVDWKRTC